MERSALVHRARLSTAPHRTSLKLTVLGVCLALCAYSRQGAAELDADCTALGLALVEHSCFHSTFGPFRSVQATPGSTLEANTPSLDPVHTEHRVGFSDPDREHVVSYAPERSGSWVVFTGSDLELSVRDPDGRALEITFEQRGTTGCEALPVARVFELESGTRYSLELGPSVAAAEIVVIEYAADFLVRAGRDADGDGFGSEHEAFVTNCVPDVGYAANVLDCDDDDPNVHPLATEICGDDVDQNCNGSLDDEGLECRVGEGECRAIGRLSCPGPGQAPICSTDPKQPQPEQCNGRDDDCNGVIDDAADLCPDVDAPACVREAFGAYCGCLLDQDCGDRASGRVCDGESRSCRDGCRANGAGNGCPKNFVCNESEMNGLGRCVAHVDPSVGTRSIEAGEASEGGCECAVHHPSRRPFVQWWLGVAGAFWVWRRRGSRSRSLLVASSLGLTSACGAASSDAVDTTETPEGTEGVLPRDCAPRVARDPIEHACIHVQRGPFVNVVADTELERAPPVDVIHTTYVVQFPEREAGPFHFRYAATRAGPHAVFTSRHLAELWMSEASGEPLPIESSGPVPGCQELAETLVVTLETGRLYGVVLEPEDAEPELRRESTLLFIEHLETFGEHAWECD